MKAVCQYSNIPFTLLHFSKLQQKQPVICVHPVFYASTEQLLAYYDTYEAGELQSLEDQRLLFLALLNATSQVDWHCAADPAPAVVAQNMKSLYHHITWLHNLAAAKDINYRLPRFSINPTTKKLTTFRHWLDAWADAYEQFQKGYRSQVERDRMQSLERRLKEIGPISADNPRANTAFLRCLADWCAIAADFPSGVSDLWKDIIRCESNIEALNMNAADIDELEEWLQDNIEPGAGYQHAALKQVREVKAAQGAYGMNEFTFLPSAGVLGAEDTSQWQMDLSSRSTTEVANIRNMIETAPINPPQRTDYNSDVEYSVAKAKYIMAQMAAGNVGVKVRESRIIRRPE
jgi:hypothetical protein